MKVKNHTWAIERLCKLEPKINPKPQYQRGPVWKQADKQLLIDSILRGFDIPKVYLRKVNTPGYDYEVADGQQRLRSIWEFLQDEYALAANCPISGCAGRKYSDLPKSRREQIERFTLVTAVAYNASSSEIRELFIRLQRGMRLSQPEIRNAIASQLGDLIRTMAATHPFCRNGPFSNERFKTDDLIAHGFLLELEGIKHDVKAPELRDMYRNYASGVSTTVQKQVARVLDVMDAMQTHVSRCISRKWGFVDVYWVISQRLKAKRQVDPKILAKKYYDFEVRRLQFVSRPEDLVAGKPSAADKDLFKYIEAFKTSAGLSENVETRHRVLSKALA